MFETFKRYFAYFVIVVSVLMFINEFEIIVFNIGFDKILACCLLIFVMEIIIFLEFIIKPRKIKISDVIGQIIFLAIPCIYIGIFYMGMPFVPYIQLVVVITMFIQSIYTLGL